MTKKHSLQLVLNEIRKSDDPTLLECTFVVLDYEKSNNNVVVSREVALQGAKTLLNKPIVAAYREVEEPNTNTDNFGSHEDYLSVNRYGDLTIKTDTEAIGVFTTEGYETVVNVDGKDKTVLAADAVLWRTRFSDACDLLLEWYDRGININTSCEYLYSNYSFKDGVEYHHSPIYFEGHAVLASENRGETSEVLPAYESSKLLSFNEINKFNKLVAQAIDQQKDALKEVKNMEEKEVIQEEVKEEQVTEEVVTETPAEEVKEEVVEPEKVEEPSVEAPVENEEVTALKSELAQLKEELSKVKAEKDSLHEQFNSATEKLTQLNSQVLELQPFKEQVESETFAKSLNAKKDFYSAKFTALNAKEKFDSEEVQALVGKTVFETEEGKEAILQLNTMLVEMVEVKTEVTNEPSLIKEVASKRENLIPSATDFDSRYGA